MWAESAWPGQLALAGRPGFCPACGGQGTSLTPSFSLCTHLQQVHFNLCSIHEAQAEAPDTQDSNSAVLAG